LKTDAPHVKQLVLIGGGHTHALLVKRLCMHPIAGLRVVLISNVIETPYSGMLPGLIAGIYTREQTHIDVARLAEMAGATFILDRAAGIDKSTRLVHLNEHPPIHFDLLSIDVGITPQMEHVDGARQHSTPIKPVPEFLSMWQKVCEQSRHKAIRIIAVGGGAGGAETALAMRESLGDSAVIDIVDANNQLLNGHSARAASLMLREFHRHHINVHLNARVTSVSAEHIMIQGRTRLPYDYLFWLTSAEPPLWFRKQNLALDEKGFLAVDSHLRVVGEPNIFAAGDCATMVDSPRPKAGVFAVRQAPHLYENIKRTLMIQPLQSFKPQKHYMALMRLPRNRTLFSRHQTAFNSSWMWRLKHRIDQKFMDAFADLKPMMRSLTAQSNILAESLELQSQSKIQCRGCAGKLSHEDLIGSFAQLSPTAASLLDDDACESTIDGHRYLLQSIDGLSDLVGDPFLFGQIALEHACNDVAAKGVKPNAALVSVDVPRASSMIMRDMLGQVTSGFQKACSTHRLHYLGGHTSIGAELKIHCSITAWHNESVVWSKGKCRVGDLIVVTKPIGTAALLAAHMQGLCKGVWREQAIQSMLQSHLPIVAHLRQFDISSGTDITGFGLGVHVAQLIKGQDELSIQIHVDEIACLDGFLEVTDRKVRSSLFEDNLLALSQFAHPDLCDELAAAKLCNPETSGPLALALPAEHAHTLVMTLQKHGFERARIIGRVVHKPEQGFSLLPSMLR